MAESHEQTVIYPETGLLDSQELIGEARCFVRVTKFRLMCEFSL